MAAQPPERVRKRLVWFSPFLLAVALSPVIFQTTPVSCGLPGDTTLSTLELEVLGQNHIAFDSTQRRYEAWLPATASTMTVRAFSTDPAAVVTYELRHSNGLREQGDLGVGGGQISLALPPTGTGLKISVAAPEGAKGSYSVYLHVGCSDCDDGSECTTDSCDAVVEQCVHVPLWDGTSCDLGAVVGVCQDGECASERSWGTPEFIETDDSGDAWTPNVAMDPNGNAIVVWSQSDGVRTNIMATRYTPGSGWGTAELIETEDAGNANEPQVAMDPSGAAMAVWRQYHGTQHNIWANRYTPGGGWGTPELIQTDDGNLGFFPKVAVDSNGNAVVVWMQQDAPRFDVWSNRYTPTSGWGTAELIGSDGTAGSTDLAMNGNGDATAVWMRVNVAIWSNHYTAAGGWGASESISATHPDWPDVAIDSNGNAVVVWSQPGVYSCHYTSGVGWGATQQIAIDGNLGFLPHVAVDPSGNAVAVWWQEDDGVGYKTWSNRYTPTGGWGTAERIETDDAGSAFEPQVAMDPNGNALAVWKRQDGGSLSSIWSNRYTPTGGWGTAELVQTAGLIDSAVPVAMDPNGNAIVVWSESDGVRYNIWANRF